MGEDRRETEIFPAMKPPIAYLLVLTLSLAGCVLPESASERQIAAEFGGSASLAGRYRNEGFMIMEGTRLSTTLFGAVGKLPPGEFFKPVDVVEITMPDAGPLRFSWVRGERVISSVSLEREKDYVVVANKVIIKTQRLRGGGLAGSRQFEFAVDKEGRLNVLETEAYGRDVGGSALLSKRFVNIMTFEPEAQIADGK